MGRYTWEGHTIELRPFGAACDTCSLPLVIANAVAFMHVNAVRVLVIDGQEIRRL